MPLFLKTIEGILLLSLPVYVYIFLAVFWSLRTVTAGKDQIKKLKAILITAFVLHLPPLLLCVYEIFRFRLSQGGLDSETLSGLLVSYGLIGSFLVAVQSAFFLVVIHAIIWVTVKAIRRHEIRLRKVFAWTALLTTVFFSLYVPSRIVCDSLAVRMDKMEIRIRNLPESLDGFRIAVIADIQMDRFTDIDKTTEYIGLINRENPDLVLFAGDIVQATTKSWNIHQGAEMLSKLNARYGVCSVIGDHDFWLNPDTTVSALEKLGISVGTNKIKRIFVGAGVIDLLCLTNVWNDPADSMRISNLLGESRSGHVSIMLTHHLAEEIARKCVEADVHFIAAGHTHGGQIGFYSYGFRLTSSLLESPFVSGAYYIDSTLAYVCNGLGMSVIPVRYNSTPSFGLVTLKRK